MEAGYLEDIQLNPGVEKVYIMIDIISIGCKDDSKAFIFTLKNPYGVKPAQFMKKKESSCAIYCDPDSGPAFGNEYSDISIADNCTKEDSCLISNPSHLQYVYHPEYKSSLFVNTNEPNSTNRFTVLDYEVYSCDICKKYVYDNCKYPDIIWNYIETKEISNESLEMITNEDEIRDDLNLIQCKDNTIRLKISQYFLKNPSKYLPNTQIVDKQYDYFLRKWLGNYYKWKLIYRASEHEYSAKSFHECCNDKGPTLIVIKSDGGWIFGGYTTQSWSGESIYYD